MSSVFSHNQTLWVVGLGLAFLAIIAIAFLWKKDTPTPQITMGEQVTEQPSADNVDPTFHSRLMALQQQLEEAPRDTSVMLDLARLHQDAHQMEEAAAVYTQLLDIVPDHRQAHLDLALCYSELGRWEDALATMDTLLEHYPDDPSGLYNLAAIHANQGRYDEARAIWERVAAQTEDVQLASQASSSLDQLDAVASAPRPSAQPATQSSGSGGALPEGHPTVPMNNEYQPVIAGQ